jgi:hypothetical protein
MAEHRTAADCVELSRDCRREIFGQLGALKDRLGGKIGRSTFWLIVGAAFTMILLGFAYTREVEKTGQDNAREIVAINKTLDAKLDAILGALNALGAPKKP